MTMCTPSPGVLETEVNDEDLLPISPEAEAPKGTPLPKSVMAAFRRAKRASDARNTKARQLCASLRVKREGGSESSVIEPREPVKSKGQSLLTDF